MTGNPILDKLNSRETNSQTLDELIKRNPNYNNVIEYTEYLLMHLLRLMRLVLSLFS